MTAAEEIGRAIRTKRVDCGITQQALADRLGLSHNTVSRWERGLTAPRDITAVCDALGCSLPDLIGAISRG